MHGCKSVERTRSLHCVMSTDNRPWTLYTRDYSCFCSECIFENYVDCKNQELGYVSEWKMVPLDVFDTYEDSNEDENFEDIPLISGDYDHISGLIKKGTYMTYTCKHFLKNDI